MYSALKVGGKKLYELAREGKEVERKARRVRILALEIHGISPAGGVLFRDLLPAAPISGRCARISERGLAAAAA